MSSRERLKRNVPARAFDLKSLQTSLPPAVNQGSRMSSKRCYHSPKCSRNCTRKQGEITKYTSNANVLRDLEEILGNIRLEYDSSKEKKRHLTDKILLSMISELKDTSPLFKLLYKEIAFVGSFYEGLKISDPDEFDLNIVLQFPFDMSCLQQSVKGKLPGHLTISCRNASVIPLLRNSPHHKELTATVLGWLDDKGNFITHRVRQWMESLCSKFCNFHNEHLHRDDEEFIHMRKNGPALTFIFNDISVDLVPSFEFVHSPPIPILPSAVKDIDAQPWYIVPKPFKTKGFDNVWRISFYHYEKIIMKNNGRIKPAIKLMKKFRDNQNWHRLDSYCIKTIALWMLENNEIKSSDKIDVVFTKLLKRLHYHLQVGKLPYYWDVGFDKFGHMTPQDMQNKAGFLNKILNGLELDGSIDYDLFTDDEDSEDDDY